MKERIETEKDKNNATISKIQNKKLEIKRDIDDSYKGKEIISKKYGD